MKTQTFLLAFIAAGAANLLTGQEYLVTVDPVTGVHSKTLAIASTKSIHVVPAFTTIDNVHNRFFYKGITWSDEDRFYIINGNNGAVNREMPFPSSNLAFNNIGNLQYDDSTGNIYCTGIHLASNEFFLLRMDTMTAAVTTVAVIPDVNAAVPNQSA